MKLPTWPDNIIVNLFNKLKVASLSSWLVSSILWSITQINHGNRVHVLVGWELHTFANHSLARDKFTNTKKLVKKLARIEASSVWRNSLPMGLKTVFVPFTHTNLSLPTWVAQLRFAIWRPLNRIDGNAKSFSKNTILIFSIPLYPRLPWLSLLLVVQNQAGLLPWYVDLKNRQ